MSAIRSRDTKPELLVRQGLHREGFRYRLHARDLPGTPDLVLPKYKAVVFVHGCFWHRHDCPRFKLPSTRTDFWLAKILENCARDAANYETLKDLGWRIGTVWECALSGPGRVGADVVVRKLARWLRGKSSQIEVRGA